MVIPGRCAAAVDKVLLSPTCDGAAHPRCHLLCQVSPASGLPPVTYWTCKCYKVCVDLSASDLLLPSQWVAPDGPAISTGGKVIMAWRSAQLSSAAFCPCPVLSCQLRVHICQLLVQRWRVLCAKPPGYSSGEM
jgi:hypothetical protein